MTLVVEDDFIVGFTNVTKFTESFDQSMQAISKGPKPKLALVFLITLM